MKLNPPLKTQFKKALSNYHQSLWKPSLSGEIEFIDRTVASLQNLNFFGGKQSLKTRSKSIHLTPHVRFYRHPLLHPNKHTTVEMGDLLLVYKHFRDGVLDTYRAIIVQAKYTKGKKKTWRIDTNQFYFLTQWPRFRIVRPTSKKWHYIKPRTLTWASYAFVGPTRYPLYYSSTRISHHRKRVPSQKSFSFPVRYCVGWDSSTSFLLKFVQGFVGENLLSNIKVKRFVDDLYTLVKWKPDPPGELEWTEDSDEKDKGFGVVEFTVVNDDFSISGIIIVSVFDFGNNLLVKTNFLAVSSQPP